IPAPFHVAERCLTFLSQADPLVLRYHALSNLAYPLLFAPLRKQFAHTGLWVAARRNAKAPPHLKFELAITSKQPTDHGTLLWSLPERGHHAICHQSSSRARERGKSSRLNGINQLGCCDRQHFKRVCPTVVVHPAPHPLRIFAVK